MKANKKINLDKLKRRSYHQATLICQLLKRYPDLTHSHAPGLLRIARGEDSSMRRMDVVPGTRRTAVASGGDFCIIGVVQVIFLLAALILTGCQHSALRQDTLAMASTLTDLQYRMVLDNLAMLSQQPDVLPWHVKLDDGNVQVEDEGRLSLDVSPLTSDWQPLVGSFVERRGTQQWGLVPVTDPKELRDLQALYRRAMGARVEGERLEELDDVPEKWFQTGSRREVPDDAVYVGRWRDRYAWVESDHTRELTEFTLAVLSIVRLKPGDRGFDRGIIPDPSD